jgi:hypothetical protein
MTDNIIMPLGWLAGKDISLSLALKMLTDEMLGHAADLEHKAERQGGANFGGPEAQKDLARASDLRRYGWALLLIWLQADPQAAQATPGGDTGSLAELAQQYNLILPPALGGTAPK